MVVEDTAGPVSHLQEYDTWILLCEDVFRLDRGEGRPALPMALSLRLEKRPRDPPPTDWETPKYFFILVPSVAISPHADFKGEGSPVLWRFWVHYVKTVLFDYGEDKESEINTFDEWDYQDEGALKAGENMGQPYNLNTGPYEFKLSSRPKVSEHADEH